TYAYSVDGGSFGPAGGSASANFSFADGPSDHTIVERILDQDGGSADYTANIHVNNVAPTATLNAPTTVNEASSFAVSLSSPADASPTRRAAGLTYAYSVDGGSFGPAGGSASANFSFADGPSDHTIVERILDKDGGH